MMGTGDPMQKLSQPNLLMRLLEYGRSHRSQDEFPEPGLSRRSCSSFSKKGWVGNGDRLVLGAFGPGCKFGWGSRFGVVCPGVVDVHGDGRELSSQVVGNLK